MGELGATSQLLCLLQSSTTANNCSRQRPEVRQPPAVRPAALHEWPVTAAWHQPCSSDALCCCAAATSPVYSISCGHVAPLRLCSNASTDAGAAAPNREHTNSRPLPPVRRWCKSRRRFLW